jgi:hypothetical protein
VSKTTSLLDRTVGESSITGDTSRWDRGGALLMFATSYRWSPIVVDEKNEDKNDTTTPKDSYGVHTRPQGG